MRRKREVEKEKEKEGEWTAKDSNGTLEEEEFGRERKRPFTGELDGPIGAAQDQGASLLAIDSPDKPKAEKKLFTEEEDKIRFSMELEFVQSLSNPEYLFCNLIPQHSIHFRKLIMPITSALAQRRVFQDKAFVNYLKYLLYWKRPEYAKYIVYVLLRTS